MADRYGSPRVRLEEARDALTAALECLGDVDDSIYSEQERMKLELPYGPSSSRAVKR